MSRCNIKEQYSLPVKAVLPQSKLEFDNNGDISGNYKVTAWNTKTNNILMAVEPINVPTQQDIITKKLLKQENAINNIRSDISQLLSQKQQPNEDLHLITRFNSINEQLQSLQSTVALLQSQISPPS